MTSINIREVRSVYLVAGETSEIRNLCNPIFSGYDIANRLTMVNNFFTQNPQILLSPALLDDLVVNALPEFPIYESNAGIEVTGGGVTTYFGYGQYSYPDNEHINRHYANIKVEYGVGITISSDLKYAYPRSYNNGLPYLTNKYLYEHLLSYVNNKYNLNIVFGV